MYSKVFKTLLHKSRKQFLFCLLSFLSLTKTLLVFYNLFILRNRKLHNISCVKFWTLTVQDRMSLARISMFVHKVLHSEILSFCWHYLSSHSFVCVNLKLFSFVKFITTTRMLYIGVRFFNCIKDPRICFALFCEFLVDHDVLATAGRPLASSLKLTFRHWHGNLIIRQSACLSFLSWTKLLLIQRLLVKSRTFLVNLFNRNSMRGVQDLLIVESVNVYHYFAT